MEKAQRKYRNFLGDNLKIILAITCVVLVFLLLRQCANNAHYKETTESAIGYLTDSVSYYKNKAGQLVAHRKAIEGENEALAVLLSKQIDSTRQLSELVENFKKVNTAGNITTITKIDTIEVPYEVPVPYEFEREFSRLTKHYKIGGFVNQSGITIDSLSIPNTLSFVIGKRKTGFFKSEYRIEAVSSNPYVQTTGLDFYSLQVPRKRLGLSLYAGYGLDRNFALTPQIGVGISYDLLQF